MSLLKQSITKKRRVNKNIRQINFNASSNKSKEYKIETIWDGLVYTRESTGYLPELYYLIL